MTKPFNPLFDKLPTDKNQVQIVASTASAPKSPASGQTMQLVYVNDIPVYADVANRIVFPVRD